MRWSGRHAECVRPWTKNIERRSTASPELGRAGACCPGAIPTCRGCERDRAAQRGGHRSYVGNSPLAASYFALWHLPFSIKLGSFAFSQSLHFLINDALMTVFFLVVGMEIRREIHEGALSKLNQAVLPVVAAVGGVVAPALIYLGLNADPARGQGWAIPTATDIAFAVGVLALLGRSIPGNVRVFLLALAIIDDVIAVLIIAFFYSGGLNLSGVLVTGFGILMVLGMQRVGVGSAPIYILPGALVWIGLLMTGAHPALAGVVLGLLTPVRSMPMRADPMDIVKRAVKQLRTQDVTAGNGQDDLARSLRQLRLGQREMLPPVVRVQAVLHPWVAYGIMPVFALANAGVTASGIDLATGGTQHVMLGVSLALVVGKPFGIIGFTWLICTFRPEQTAAGGVLEWNLPDRLTRWHRLHHVYLHLNAGLRR